MNSRLRRISRRRMLQATGVCVAIPWLESFTHRGCAAAEPAAESARLAPRLAYLYIPNGVNVANWQVSGDGENYELSPTLAPLAPSRRDFTVINGLNHENATPGPDGAGDHSRATAVYLTGVRPKKTGGSDVQNGVSVDQAIARHVGQFTRVPSLELSTDGSRTTGRCDSGYSCAYQFNLSWSSPTRPVPAEQNPRAVFERLFGTPDSSEGGTDGRKQLQKSVLDFIQDDARSLAREIGQRDREKLDQYLTAVREVELRIQRAENPAMPLPDVVRPAGIPDSYQEHIRMMFDIIALAFQTDATRMITFVLGYDGSNRAFPEIGVPEAHHQLSHHRGNPVTLEKIGRIDLFYVEQFAWFLQRLRSIQVADNFSLLDTSMIVYGGCISEGNQHLHSNLPILLAGRGGVLQPGKRLQVPDSTPMCNLHLALAQRMGLKLDRFGDSSAILQGL